MFDKIEDAIKDIQNGKLVIVVDDEDRENEGDFITSAKNVTPEIINFMSKHGRGLICMPLAESRCDELKLGLMVNDNTALHATPFTVSVDLLGHGCTTGISAHDRSRTVKAIIDPETKAEDLGRPGHIFPLRAKNGGVLRRTGHTEATIDLANLAGHGKAGVLVEIMNEDGTMARLPELSAIAKKHDLKLVVDNTFSPLSISPAQLGADVVIHSLTKFINGSSDTVGGVICGTQQFIDDLRNVNDGACMLLGSTMDSLRAASILKNLRTLHIRMQQHSLNGLYLAESFAKDGLTTVYPGLESHPSHELFKVMMNEKYGFGGMLTIDVGSLDKANALMELMQKHNLGYLAVSLGFYKTLFSAPGSSTSSEIPAEEQKEMGLSDGLIRFSIGLDDDIERTYDMMKSCMKELDIL